MEQLEVRPPNAAGMRLALGQLEKGSGTGGGFAADWKGAGMDPQVNEWINHELAQRESERVAQYRRGDLVTCARIKAEQKVLKKVREMLHRLAGGTQVVDMTKTHEGTG